MVSLNPSEIRLAKKGNCPDSQTFVKSIDGLRVKFVDLEGRAEEKKWVNSINSVTFELRQPSVAEMAYLMRSICLLKPDVIEYMHACGDHCLVFWLKWNR